MGQTTSSAPPPHDYGDQFIVCGVLPERTPLRRPVRRSFGDSRVTSVSKYEEINKLFMRLSPAPLGFTSTLSHHLLHRLKKFLSCRCPAPPEEFDCGKRYPKGLEGLQAAREAFAQTQQSLSLSLTFFEFALVVDRDDDGQYNGGELNDLFESFGMPFEDRLPSDRYIVSLNGVFDNLRQSGELKTLVNSMEVLLGKGYRFTSADQAALNRELD